MKHSVGAKLKRWIIEFGLSDQTSPNMPKMFFIFETFKKFKNAKQNNKWK